MLRDFAALVTGGAGFIGSHLAEELLNRSCNVTVIDDFSSGRMENVERLVRGRRLSLVRDYLKNPRRLKGLVSRCDLIFHFAANPEVRVGQTEPRVHFEENVLSTFNLLEAVRQSRASKVLVFASTSTVYGDAVLIPTPEDYGPLIPISTYGASKLASEALIVSYAHTFGHRALILRLANIVGPRSNHGVIPDFVKKIRANSEELEILGDGKQKKSYMYISDLIEATMHLTDRFLESPSRTEIYNVGSNDSVSVAEIAGIVAKEMGCPRIRYRFTGGVNGGRGWKGDVKMMQLSVDKLLKTGFKIRHSSKQAVQLTARKTVENSRN